MVDVVPESLRRNARPPMSMDAAPASGTASAVRPTAQRRRWVAPLLFDRSTRGHSPSDPAVRRFWTAVIGPTAVADLLRLTAAASSGRRIREPLRLSSLAAEGLIQRSGEIVLVRPQIPFLGPEHLRRLAPRLRKEYLAYIEGL
jgi:hypothetical protein